MESKRNLWLLPTDKPSRLFLKENTLLLNNQYTLQEIFPKGKHQNIYITSDEKLPYNSDIFYTGAFYHKDAAGNVHIINKDTHYPNPNFCSRIVLTTDKSLFKYGVQAIDDDFIEWFVRNPSCEWVETVFNNRGITGVEKILKTFGEYKIIIPKEEPKQETLEEVGMYKQKLFDYLHNELDVIALQSQMNEIEKIVLKMQAERMYSEEEVERIANDAYNVGKHGGINETYYDFKEWFEQFKKK